MQKIPESEFEYHRQMGKQSGYPSCCIESFLQGRDGTDVHKEYSIDWNDVKEREIFGRILDYVPCKICCAKLVGRAALGELKKENER